MNICMRPRLPVQPSHPSTSHHPHGPHVAEQSIVQPRALLINCLLRAVPLCCGLCLQEQFMSSSATTQAPTQAAAPTAGASDAAPYSDQYAAYSPYPEPNLKPSVAHV